MLETIGLFAVLLWVIKFLHRTPGMFSRKRPLTEALGPRVVITGATDGIGLEYARAVVQVPGVAHVLLIGRSLAKLGAVKQEFQSLALVSGCLIELFVFDFDVREVCAYAPLEKKLSEFNATCVINCVGVSYPSALYLHELPVEEIDKLVYVNVISSLIVGKTVYAGLRKSAQAALCGEATQRGGTTDPAHSGEATQRGDTTHPAQSCGVEQPGCGTICFLGSAASIVSEPLLTAYAGCKGAIDGLARSLHAECLGTKIGVQAQVPLMVVSKMSKVRQPSLLVPTAHDYVNGITLGVCGCVTGGMKALSYAANCSLNNHASPVVCPNLIHALALELVRMLPVYIWERFRLSEQKNIRRRYTTKLTNLRQTTSSQSTSPS